MRQPCGAVLTRSAFTCTTYGSVSIRQQESKDSDTCLPMIVTSTGRQSCNCNTVFSQSTLTVPFSSLSRDLPFSCTTRRVIFVKCFFSGSVRQGVGAGMQQSTGATGPHTGASIGFGHGQGSAHGGITGGGAQTERSRFR